MSHPPKIDSVVSDDHIKPSHRGEGGQEDRVSRIKRAAALVASFLTGNGRTSSNDAIDNKVAHKARRQPDMEGTASGGKATHRGSGTVTEGQQRHSMDRSRAAGKALGWSGPFVGTMAMVPARTTERRSSIMASSTTTPLVLLPPETQQELEEILGRVERLSSPYRIVREEGVWRRNNGQMVKSRKGFLEVVLQEPIEKALMYLSEQQFHSYTQVSVLESAQTWFNRVRADHESMEADLRSDDVAHAAEDRQTEEMTELMEANQRNASKMRDNLQRQFNSMLRTTVKRALDRRDAKHKFTMQRALHAVKSELNTAHMTIQGLHSSLVQSKSIVKGMESRLLVVEQQRQEAQMDKEKQAAELKLRIESLEKMLDAKEEKERLLESQGRQDGLEAYVDMKRKERGEMEAFKMTLRAPIHALMEKNDILKKQLEGNDKYIESLKQEVEDAKEGTAKAVERAVAPFALQVIEYEKNIEGLVRTLERYEGFKGTLTKLQDRCTDLEQVNEAQVVSLKKKDDEIEALVKQLKEKDRHVQEVKAALDKRVKDMELSMQGRQAEIEEWKGKLAESKREVGDLKSLLEVGNRKLSTVVKDSRAKEEEERREMEADLLEQELEFKKRIMALEHTIEALQNDTSTNSEALEKAKAERDKLRREREDARRRDAAAAGRPQDSRSRANSAAGVPVKTEGVVPAAITNMDDGPAKDRQMVIHLEGLLQAARLEAEEVEAEHSEEVERLQEELKMANLLLDNAKEKLAHQNQGSLEAVLDALAAPPSEEEGDDFVKEHLLPQSLPLDVSNERRSSRVSLSLERERLIFDLQNALNRCVSLSNDVRMLGQLNTQAREQLKEREAEVKCLQEELELQDQKLAAAQKGMGVDTLELSGAKEQLQLMRLAAGMSQDEVRVAYTKLIEDTSGLKVQRDVAIMEMKQMMTEVDKANKAAQKADAKRAEETKALKVALLLSKAASQEVARVRGGKAGGKVQHRKKVARRRSTASPTNDDDLDDNGDALSLESPHLHSGSPLFKPFALPILPAVDRSSHSTTAGGGRKRGKGGGGAAPRALLRLEELGELAEAIYEEGRALQAALAQQEAAEDDENEDEEGGGEEGERLMEDRQLLEEGKEHLERAVTLLANLVRGFFGSDPLNPSMSSAGSIGLFVLPSVGDESGGKKGRAVTGMTNRSSKKKVIKGRRKKGDDYDSDDSSAGGSDSGSCSGSEDGDDVGSEKGDMASSKQKKRVLKATTKQRPSVSGHSQAFRKLSMIARASVASHRKSSVAVEAPVETAEAASIRRYAADLKRLGQELSEVRTQLMGRDQKIAVLEGTIEALEEQIKKQRHDSMQRAAGDRSVLAELRMKLEAATAESASLQMVSRQAQQAMKIRKASRLSSVSLSGEGERLMDELADLETQDDSRDLEELQQQLFRMRIASIVESEKSLTLEKLMSRFDLLVLVHREREFGLLLRKEKDQKQRRALETGRASLQQRMAQCRQKIALIDTERRTRLAELTAMYTEATSVPKMIADGTSFPSVLDWARSRLRLLSHEAGQQGLSKEPRPADMPKRAEEDRIRNGIGVFFVQAVFPTTPRPEDDDAYEGNSNESEQLQDYLIFRSESYRESAVEAGGDIDPTGFLPLVALPEQALSKTEGDGQGSTLSQETSTVHGTGHMRSATEVSTIEGLLDDLFKEPGTLEGDGEEEQEWSSAPGRPEQAFSELVTAGAVGKVQLPLQPPPPIIIVTENEVINADTHDEAHGASTGMVARSPGPPSSRTPVVSSATPVGSIGAGRTPRLELVRPVPENDASTWLEDGAALLPPDNEPSYRGFSQVLANAFVARLGNRPAESREAPPRGGAGSPTSAAAASSSEAPPPQPVPFIPMSEREPLQQSIFDCLTNPEAPLVQIVTDTSIFFPLLFRKDKKNRQQPRLIARRSGGPSLLIGNSGSPQLLPDVVPPPQAASDGGGVAARGGQMQAARARQTHARNAAGARIRSNSLQGTGQGAYYDGQQRMQQRPDGEAMLAGPTATGDANEFGGGGSHHQPPQRRRPQPASSIASSMSLPALLAADAVRTGGAPRLGVFMEGRRDRQGSTSSTTTGATSSDGLPIVLPRVDRQWGS